MEELSGKADAAFDALTASLDAMPDTLAQKHLFVYTSQLLERAAYALAKTDGAHPTTSALLLADQLDRLASGPRQR